MAEALLPEYEREMAATRRLLERVPDDRFGWKPHPKSMSLGALAGHIASMAGWGVAALDQPEFDVIEAPAPAEPPSRAALLDAFDANVAATRTRLMGRTDPELLAVWRLKRGTETIFTVPKAAVLRTLILSHIIHHRGQLTVYLRLNDVPLPPIYGSTADETP